MHVAPGTIFGLALIAGGILAFLVARPLTIVGKASGP